MHQLYLVIHDQELQKKTNTAKLVLEQDESCLFSIWARKEPDLRLIEMINSGDFRPVVLFDQTFIGEDQEALNTIESDVGNPSKSTSHSSLQNKPYLFILLDGTWQQCRKMLRKSPYLLDIPMLQLNCEHKSSYTLRRNQREVGLCTAETAIELYKQASNQLKNQTLVDKAEKLQAAFDQFMTDYYAS
jgi:DTW domain-containing protein